MENTMLVGWDTHGFHTMEDLDLGSITKEARSRWLRPNEIHAILCNYSYFSINVKPVNFPPSGTITLFDRKKLRNFRKDGHNWKKKKDGKTVKEAHEHLKVGNEERIHVYYAHGEDSPTFVRRCYWLLDKALEHIVLVHYRETQEGTPTTSVYLNSSPGLSDPSIIFSDETDAAGDPLLYSDGKSQLEPGNSTSLKSHEMRLHEINTLEWEELVVPDNTNKLEGLDKDMSCFGQQDQFGTAELLNNGSLLTTSKLRPSPENSSGILSDPVYPSNSTNVSSSDILGFPTIDGQVNSVYQRRSPLNVVGEDGLQTQESFGKWMNYVIDGSPDSLNSSNLVSSLPNDDSQLSIPGQIFSITEVSPTWAYAAEETKILVTGHFCEKHLDLGKINLYCVCGDSCIPVEMVQPGVFRCLVSSHNPVLSNIFLSLDGHNPISQVVNFEYRAYPLKDRKPLDSDDSLREEFRLQTRLVHLLFSSSKSLSTLSNKVSPNALKDGKVFVHKTSKIADEWASLVHSIKNDEISIGHAKDDLLKLALKNRLYEWLLERVVRREKISDYDEQGQGVIHLCAMLDYSWAVYPFKLSGLSLDYRDKFGWTALHWAAHCGRENTVAALLSAGAKPSLVTDPNSENPDGCMAADLASKNGHDGLAAYLAEKALITQFEDMKLAGNISGSLQTENRFELVDPRDISEEELYLKDTLAAYRTAADAAGRIQTAFREHSFKLRAKAVEETSPEDEARSIVAAMKIQHAFRKFETRKQMAAAARIQYRFRTWKIRKDFLNMRRQAIKIQSIFRGYQVRRSYTKIVWSVGILEKAILRWRLRKKGFRGLQVSPTETKDENSKEESEMEAFFRAGRKQAEDRTVRAVVRVQAMFRSKQAQQEYRRMKLTHNAAQLEYEGLISPDNME